MPVCTGVPFAKGAARQASRHTPSEKVRALSRPRQLAPRAPWNPDDNAAIVPVLQGKARDNISELMMEVKHHCDSGLLQDLCVTLRGGYEVAEAVCDHGGVEIALSLVCGTAPASISAVTRHLAAEALWLMIYDHESSQRLIQAGGHGKMLRLLRDSGPKDSTLAAGGLRVLGETLYSEARTADLWRSADLEVVIEALDWALRADPARRGELLAIVCDVASLWVWRAQGAAVEAMMPLVGLIPRLLQEMAARPDEAAVLQQGCRLLHGLAGRCNYWPDNVKQATLAALRGKLQRA